MENLVPSTRIYLKNKLYMFVAPPVVVQCLLTILRQTVVMDQTSANGLRPYSSTLLHRPPMAMPYVTSKYLNNDH